MLIYVSIGGPWDADMYLKESYKVKELQNVFAWVVVSVMFVFCA